MRLAGKAAIVTGAASGFGEGIARRFAEEGARVAVADINADGAEGVAADIGEGAIGLRCDVSSSADVNRLVAETRDRFDHIDIVVNNAAAPQRNMPMLDVDEATFDRMYEVNVKSLYYVALAVIPAMRDRGGGSIINTGSTAAIRPRPGLTWYNATKGAVLTLTKSMAIELVTDGIRVNALCPTAGDTPMLAEFLGGAVTDDARARFLATIPMGRFCTPADMANAALFLASDEASFITGACLEVDGGRCI